MSQDLLCVLNVLLASSSGGLDFPLLGFSLSFLPPHGVIYASTCNKFVSSISAAFSLATSSKKQVYN